MNLPFHIIHYNLDELVDEHGNEFDGDASDFECLQVLETSKAINEIIESHLHLIYASTAKQFNITTGDISPDEEALRLDDIKAQLSGLLHEYLNHNAASALDAPKPKAATPTTTLIQDQFVDWSVEEGEPTKGIDTQPYAVNMERNGSKVFLTIGEIDSPRSQLEAAIEIANGIPTIHIGNCVGGDHVLHIIPTKEGIFCIPNSDRERVGLEPDPIHGVLSAYFDSPVPGK